MKYDYIIVGSGPSAMGVIEGIKRNNKEATIAVIEEGYNVDYQNIFLNSQNIVKRKDKSGRYIFEPRCVGGEEATDDLEFYIYDQNDFEDEGDYTYQDFMDAYKECNFKIQEERHPKTVLFNEIEKLYENSTYSYHNCIPISEETNYVTKKSYYKDNIDNNGVTLYNHSKVEYIKLCKYDELYFANGVKLEQDELEADKEVILCNGLSTCELLKRSGIYHDGDLIKNDNIGKHIASELQFDAYYYVDDNRLSNFDKEYKNNELYYRLNGVFNGTLFVYLFGFGFAWLFNFLYTLFFDKELVWIKYVIFSLCGILDGFVLAWTGFKLLWIIAFTFGTISSFIYFTYHGIPVVNNLNAALFYWFFHVITGIITNYNFNKNYVNPGNESMIAIRTYFENYYQKATILTNLQYKFIRKFFCNIYETIIKCLMWMSYWFGLKYLLFHKVMLLKNVTFNASDDGTYIYEDGKWVLDLKTFEKRDIVEDFIQSLRMNLKLLNNLNISKLYPFRKLKESDLTISSNIVGCCRMGSSEVDSVVNQEDGLVVFGTWNLRIIGTASWKKPIRNSNSLLLYLFGFITANKKF